MAVAPTALTRQISHELHYNIVINGTGLDASQLREAVRAELDVGINITPQIRDWLLAITITDEAGLEADTVTITLDDPRQSRRSGQRHQRSEVPQPGPDQAGRTVPDQATLSGDPLIATEGRILAPGFLAGIDDLWSIRTATHMLDGNGFSTSVSAERPEC